MVPLFYTQAGSSSPEAYMNTKNQMELFQERTLKQTNKSENYVCVLFAA